MNLFGKSSPLCGGSDNRDVQKTRMKRGLKFRKVDVLASQFIIFKRKTNKKHLFTCFLKRYLKFNNTVPCT